MLTEPNLIVTVYNQGSALVRERRTVELHDGLNTLDILDIPEKIEPATVTFHSLDEPDSTRVLEQNYLYDLGSDLKLLNRCRDTLVEVALRDGSVLGRLLSVRPSFSSGAIMELMLETADGHIITMGINHMQYVRALEVPSDLVKRPTLRWLLETNRPGAQRIEMNYLTGGMNWRAEYNLLLSAGNTSFDLNGWITLDNSSGRAYQDAQVKLVAGDLQRQRRPQPQRQLGVQHFVSYARMPDPVEQREVFEYQLYAVQRPVTLAQNETKQIEFLNVGGVPARTLYVMRPIYPWNGYGNRVQSSAVAWEAEESAVQTWLEFSTGVENGIGKDLPAGDLRAYQLDSDGAPVLIGESSIDHTPTGERIRIELGKAFDLRGERKQTQYRQAGKGILEETFEIRIRNQKDNETVTVAVHERLFRWQNWTITTASHSYTTLNAWTVAFDVSVPAGGETVLSYTVRYTEV